MITTAISTAKRYAFLQHTRRMVKITIVAGIVLVISALIIVLAIENLLPPGLGDFVAFAGVLAILSFILLVPMIVFLYAYSRGGWTSRACACIFRASPNSSWLGPRLSTRSMREKST